MVSRKTVKNLTKDMQYKMGSLRMAGLKAAFAYFNNSTMCFIYDENDPVNVKAYAQAVKCDRDDHNPKFARALAFGRAYRALTDPTPKLFNDYHGANYRNAQYRIKQTGEISARCSIPACIIIKSRELAIKLESKKEESYGTSG